MSENKERISMSKFVEGYKKLTNEQLKDRYIKERVKTTYAPILQKKLILEMMHNKSVVETPVKRIDMTVSHLNVIMAILVLYTDIEPDKKENDDGTTTPLTWDAYDALKSTGIYEKLLNAIGSDLEELMLIQGQIMDTWVMENTSTQAYVNNVVENASSRFGVAIEIILNKLDEILEDEVKMKKFMSALEKTIKKIK
jgi:hypothetical protein